MDNNISFNINFGLHIKLSDKGLLNLPQKTNILYSVSPMDFFYKESKNKKKLDELSIKTKARIRKEQQKPNNSEIKSFILKKCFNWANKLRSLASKILIFENLKAFYRSFKLINSMSPASPEYIEEWAKLGNSLQDKFINMNIEDGNIETIAKSGEPHIFLLNHDNPEKDKFIYPIFNSFLNYAYTAYGKQNTCPRPNIIVSKNVINLVNRKFRNIYLKMGLIPVDADISNTGKDNNAGALKYIITRFLNGKCNLFIFPEGNNSIYKNKSLEEKFQPTAAKIIKSILSVAKTVKIVPIGLSYNSTKNSIGSVHIGNIINLQNLNDEIRIDSDSAQTLGNITGKESTKNLIKFLSSKLTECIKLSKNQ